MKIPKKAIAICAFCAVLVTGLIVLTSYFITVENYRAKVRAISFSGVDVRLIPDGSYTGEYDVGFVYAKVEVTVTSGEIVGINLLEHKNERGGAAEVIVNKIIDEQTIDVDTVTSATNSSKVIKKAVENALVSGAE